MGSIKLDLTIYGGKADDARVEVSRMADILQGIAKDVRDVCRNLSQEDTETPWPEKEASCRLYVAGMPTKGKSVTLPLASEESPVRWGVLSGEAYIEGLAELRSARLQDNSLPKGFDREILKRVSGYFDFLGTEYEGMTLEAQVNGKPALRADFDARLKARVQVKLDALPKGEKKLVERKLYGYQVEGILYELSDPDYDDPRGAVRFEVDPQDGTRWVCSVPRSLAPANMKDLWRTRVRVEGVANFRPKKPTIAVDRVIPLSAGRDPVAAFRDLIRLSQDARTGERVEEIMERIRERS